MTVGRRKTTWTGRNTRLDSDACRLSFYIELFFPIFAKKKKTMNQLVLDLWPYIVTATLPVLIAGIVAINRIISKLRTKVAVLEMKLVKVEEDVGRIDLRVDRKSKQFAEIQKEVMGMREDLAEIKGDLKSLAGELRTSLKFLKSNV